MTRLLLAAAVSIGLLEVGLPPAFFAVPEGPLVCRAVATTVADSAYAMFEFAYGEEYPWETLAAFDSAGTPLYMTVHQTVPEPTASVSHNVAVRFSLGGQYIRVERAVRNGRVVQDSPPVVRQTDLTPDEVAKSKILAGWFWSHRCSS